MKAVLMEVERPDGAWVRVGSVGEPEPPGSISADGPSGRRVLLFGWVEGEAGVWESTAGVDVETDAFREITSVGLDRLADLTEPFYLEIIRGGLRMPLRFSLVG